MMGSRRRSDSIIFGFLGFTCLVYGQLDAPHEHVYHFAYVIRGACLYSVADAYSDLGEL
jgi:hypothetical protein